MVARTPFSCEPMHRSFRQNGVLELRRDRFSRDRYDEKYPQSLADRLTVLSRVLPISERSNRGGPLRVEHCQFEISAQASRLPHFGSAPSQGRYPAKKRRSAA